MTMNPIQTSLKHKILEPRRRSAGKHPTLVLLHGRGASENDLLGLTEYLDERLMIFSVRAPFAFRAGEGYTWYELVEVGRPEPAMFAESYNKLLQFFDDMIAHYPVNQEKIFFGGFSMGTVMSYALALTRPESVKGVIANSGYIPEETELQFKWENIKAKPFFVGHGKYDPVIPLVFAQRAQDLLMKAGAHVTYHEYDMAHQINEESLNDMMGWITKQMGDDNSKMKSRGKE